MRSKAVRLTILIISASVCFAAAGAGRAVGRVGQERSGSGQTESPKLKEARELGTSGDLRNTHRLLALLKDSDERVRVAAAQGLGSVLDHYALGPDLSMGDDEPILSITSAIRSMRPFSYQDIDRHC